MDEELFEKVYETVLGLRVEDLAEGVEDAFAPGSFCDRKYGEMLAAYTRLRDRLGAGDEDADVETIINAFLDMEKVLCREMFACGLRFGAADTRK